MVSSSLRIYVVRFRGDDPKLSTALKLVRLGYAVRTRVSDLPVHTVVLNPYSRTVLHPGDSSYVVKGGLAVLDTSWNTGLDLLKELAGKRRYEQRVLPALKAGNPVNFGVLTKLSSVEALAASLYITGFKDYAFELLSKFKWGLTFYELNKEYLERYSAAISRDEVLRIQAEILRLHGL